MNIDWWSLLIERHHHAKFTLFKHLNLTCFQKAAILPRGSYIQPPKQTFTTNVCHAIKQVHCRLCHVVHIQLLRNLLHLWGISSCWIVFSLKCAIRLSKMLFVARTDCTLIFKHWNVTGSVSLDRLHVQRCTTRTITLHNCSCVNVFI